MTRNRNISAFGRGDARFENLDITGLLRVYGFSMKPVYVEYDYTVTSRDSLVLVKAETQDVTITVPTYLNRDGETITRIVKLSGDYNVIVKFEDDIEDKVLAVRGDYVDIQHTETMGHLTKEGGSIGSSMIIPAEGVKSSIVKGQAVYSTLGGVQAGWDIADIKHDLLYDTTSTDGIVDVKWIDKHRFLVMGRIGYRGFVVNLDTNTITLLNTFNVYPSASNLQKLNHDESVFSFTYKLITQGNLGVFKIQDDDTKYALTGLQFELQGVVDLNSYKINDHTLAIAYIYEDSGNSIYELRLITVNLASDYSSATASAPVVVASGTVAGEFVGVRIVAWDDTYVIAYTKNDNYVYLARGSFDVNNNYAPQTPNFTLKHVAAWEPSSNAFYVERCDYHNLSFIIAVATTDGVIFSHMYADRTGIKRADLWNVYAHQVTQVRVETISKHRYAMSFYDYDAGTAATTRFITFSFVDGFPQIESDILVQDIVGSNPLSKLFFAVAPDNALLIAGYDNVTYYNYYMFGSIQEGFDFVGIALNDSDGNSAIKVVHSDIVSTSGLIPYASYFSDKNGNLINDINNFKVGKALTENKLLLEKGRLE